MADTASSTDSEPLPTQGWNVGLCGPTTAVYSFDLGDLLAVLAEAMPRLPRFPASARRAIVATEPAADLAPGAWVRGAGGRP
jgi:hypothetical protein